MGCNTQLRQWCIQPMCRSSYWLKRQMGVLKMTVLDPPFFYVLRVASLIKGSKSDFDTTAKNLQLLSELVRGQCG